ncbi:MAG TPA: aminotransferase class V-fold PLP-dependent enzyme [Casimicrobiaceae bacterium]|nr:aminotransferase class V-fold PLP-dependent enzyme [Casimicrobiaceae bacterium]
MTTAEAIRAAVAAMGDAALTEDALREHVWPLFSRVRREMRCGVYLANHSLGRPPDAVETDVREALALWYARLGGAWEGWRDEMLAFRSRLAELLGVARADAIIPKTSAGQGLRAVLNTWDTPLHVVATRGEFDSVDVILREYAARGRITLDIVPAREDGRFESVDIERAVRRGVALVVLSPVMFQTGQHLTAVERIVAAAHAVGARVLLDVYHAAGVVPMNLAALDADFAIGGSYKYLRGGPGACYLYVHPRHLEAGLRTLDIGWFAKEDAFDYERPDPPRYAPGGDAWLESTPPILPFYQARAGQVLTLALGVARLRAYNLQQQCELVAHLAEQGMTATGATHQQGAFVAVRDARARSWVARLAERGVMADARGEWLRLCPDVLTPRDELAQAAKALGEIARA